MVPTEESTLVVQERHLSALFNAALEAADAFDFIAMKHVGDAVFNQIILDISKRLRLGVSNFADGPKGHGTAPQSNGPTNEG